MHLVLRQLLLLAQLPLLQFLLALLPKIVQFLVPVINLLLVSFVRENGSFLLDHFSATFVDLGLKSRQRRLSWWLSRRIVWAGHIDYTPCLAIVNCRCSEILRVVICAPMHNSSCWLINNRARANGCDQRALRYLIRSERPVLNQTATLLCMYLDSMMLGLILILLLLRLLPWNLLLSLSQLLLLLNDSLIRCCFIEVLVYDPAQRWCR